MTELLGRFVLLCMYSNTHARTHTHDKTATAHTVFTHSPICPPKMALPPNCLPRKKKKKYDGCISPTFHTKKVAVVYRPLPVCGRSCALLNNASRKKAAAAAGRNRVPLLGTTNGTKQAKNKNATNYTHLATHQ